MSQDDLTTALSSIRIVLVEPAGPLNVGSVARVMKNFGLRHLVLVSPQCDPLGEEAMQMAVHAKDLLHEARVVESIPAALAGCYRAIATTARPRDINTPLALPEQALPSLLQLSVGKHNPQGESALLFGPEDRGLSNEELIHAQQFVKIPTDDGYSALNLAQAVAICCYELYRAESAQNIKQDIQQNIERALRTSPPSGKQTESRLLTEADFNPAQVQNPACSYDSTIQVTAFESPVPTDLARLDELEGYYQHLASVLLAVEYLYPHTAASRMRKIRQLLQRAAPTSAEVALLRGMLRQLEWALSESKKG